MVEKITITPQEVRGLGDIISPKTLSDFNKQYSTLTTTTDTVHGATTTVYDLDSTILFSDGGTTNNKNTNWVNYSNRLGITTDENGTTINKGSSNGYYLVSVNGEQFIFTDYICEFDVVTKTGQVIWYHQGQNTTYQDVMTFTNYSMDGKHIKITCQDGVLKMYIDGVQQGSNITVTSTPPMEIGFRINAGATTGTNIKYKNLIIYNE